MRGLQFANETAQAIPIQTLNSGNIGNWNSLMDSSMAAYQSAIVNYINDGSTITVPKKTISYTDIDGLAQTKSWKGAVYMVENASKGYAAAIIAGGLGGGYPLLNSTAPVVNYNIDNFTPSTLISTSYTGNPVNGFSFLPTNSTTQANGQNSLQVFSNDPVNQATGNLNL